MKPKIPDLATWQQAELIMQPAFIRLVDVLRQQLETSEWEATYEDVELWPEHVTQKERSQYTQLTQTLAQQQLEPASAQAIANTQARLAELEGPVTGHRLLLAAGSSQQTFDLWQLCYQICFQDYEPQPLNPTDPLVQIDSTLFNQDGEVDWGALEQKVQTLVKNLFANLPTVSETVAARAPAPEASS
ncbi:MAG: hypothetical protein AAGF24_15065 [Cyanobacteria bacterium P01_H01_bin.121]